MPWGGKTRKISTVKILPIETSTGVGSIGINPKVRDWHPWVVVANCTNRKIGSAGLKGDSFFSKICRWLMVASQFFMPPQPNIYVGILGGV